MLQPIKIPPGSDPFILLPIECIQHIFSMLNCHHHLTPLRFVCQRFRKLLPHIPEHPDFFVHYIAYQGFLNLLVWAKSQGCPLTKAALGAVAGGHLPILEWLSQYQTKWDDPEYTEVAMRCGKEEALQWLTARGCPLPEFDNSPDAWQEETKSLR